MPEEKKKPVLASEVVELMMKDEGITSADILRSVLDALEPVRPMLFFLTKKGVELYGPTFYNIVRRLFCASMDFSAYCGDNLKKEAEGIVDANFLQAYHTAQDAALKEAAEKNNNRFNGD